MTKRLCTATVIQMPTAGGVRLIETSKDAYVVRLLPAALA